MSKLNSEVKNDYGHPESWWDLDHFYDFICPLIPDAKVRISLTLLLQHLDFSWATLGANT